MNSIFGQTRTFVGARHALLTPDGHVPSVLLGVEGARVIAHITPAMGARFSQYTIFFEAQGAARFSPSPQERFFYVQQGQVNLVLGENKHRMSAGGYAFIPQSVETSLHVQGEDAKVIVFEKKFVALAGASVPPPIVRHVDEVTGQPFLGNPRALLQVLLPDEPAFDLAVNIFSYEPGATLPFVETHIMEHGLVMLGGQGIYRLEDKWYPVAEGDIIWMAPFCPQWFVAMGNTPATYLYYKDVNRPFAT